MKNFTVLEKNDEIISEVSLNGFKYNLVKINNNKKYIYQLQENNINKVLNDRFNKGYRVGDDSIQLNKNEKDNYLIIVNKDNTEDWVYL